MISYDNVYTIRKLKELELSIDVLISKRMVLIWPFLLANGNLMSVFALFENIECKLHL